MAISSPDLALGMQRVVRFVACWLLGGTGCLVGSMSPLSLGEVNNHGEWSRRMWLL